MEVPRRSRMRRTINSAIHFTSCAAGSQGCRLRPWHDLLGHSSIAITGDVYGHTSDDTARAAVDGLAARLGL